VIPGDGTVTESVGGYEDWLARREEPSSTTPEEAPAAERERPRREGPRKLSYREQRELEALPGRISEAEGRIAALEEERESLQETLADPAFYREEPSRVVEAKGRLEALEREVAEAYDRWEALEEARAELSAVASKG
jgi:ATP-binding cassette subfamily F protein uup